MVRVILFRLYSMIQPNPSVILYNYLGNGWNQVDIGPIDLILGSNFELNVLGIIYKLFRRWQPLVGVILFRLDSMI